MQVTSYFIPNFMTKHNIWLHLVEKMVGSVAWPLQDTCDNVLASLQSLTKANVCHCSVCRNTWAQ